MSAPAELFGLPAQLERVRLAWAELRGAVAALGSIGQGAILEPTVVLTEDQATETYARTRVDPSGDLITRLRLGSGEQQEVDITGLIVEHQHLVRTRAAEARGRLRVLLDAPRLLTAAIAAVWAAGVSLYYALTGLLQAGWSALQSFWAHGLTEAFLADLVALLEPLVIEAIGGIIGPLLWTCFLRWVWSRLRARLERSLRDWAEGELGLSLG